MAPIELIGTPQSVFVRTTRMAFEEKGVAYSLTAAAPHSDAVNAIHPFGRIPVMRQGGFVLFESKAIATYIDRHYRGPELIPWDAAEAALVEQWISAIVTGVFPATVGYMRANAFPPAEPGRRDEKQVAVQLASLRRNIEILERTVAVTGHLTGQSFTLADMYLMPLLGYWITFPESRTMMAEAVHLSLYYATHSLRNSFIKTTPPPMAELRR
jgi:glutathione S-transferase